MDPNPHYWSNGASAIAYSEVISGSDERSNAASKFPGGSSGSANTTFCLGYDSKRNFYDSVRNFYDSERNFVLVPDESCPVPGQVHGCNQSEAEALTSLNESILIDLLDLQCALSDPEEVITCHRSGHYLYGGSRWCTICRTRQERRMHLSNLYPNRSPFSIFCREGKRSFMVFVTTAEKGYTMTGLPDDVIAACFSEEEQEEIKASGLRVPSIWDLHQQRHLLKPIRQHILDNLKEKAWTCHDPDFLCKLKLDDYDSKLQYKLRRSVHGSSNGDKVRSVNGSSNRVRFSRGFSNEIILLGLSGLRNVCSNPKLAKEYSSFLDQNGFKSSDENVFDARGSNFLVSTSNRSYILTDLSTRVISTCFYEPYQSQIAASGLLVPSIRDLALNEGLQSHLLIPLRNDIFTELEAEAAAHPHAASVHMPAEFPDCCVNRNNAVQKFLPASSDESQVRTSPGQLYLLHPGELEVACSHPDRITEYLSIRDKKCSKSSRGEPMCRCEICEIKRKHEVLLGKSKIQEQYDKGARFLVTTDKRDYNVTNLSARTISTYFPEADQGQIAAQGLQVPSIWDLPQKTHLLKPLHKDILKEFKAEAAVHPQAAFVHVPPQLHDDYSNRDNAGSPKLLAASSDQLNSSNEVMINITPSECASSNPDSRHGASFQLQSIEAEPPCNATFLERARGCFQPGNEETEPLFNRGRMTETILVVASQVSLTLLTQGSTSGSHLSPNAKILNQFAAICNAVGFFCCLFGILVCGRKPGRAARITTGCGYIVTAYGFLAMMAMTLSDELMLWFTGVTCIALFPVLAFAFMK